MIAFVFPGQGSQYPGMGKHILQINPEYRKYLEIARVQTGVNLERIIFGEDDNLLNLTEHTQPAVLTISYIHYRYSRDMFSMVPQIFAGHSLGEWTALVAARVISFEDAVRLVYLRGIYMSEACSPYEGSMIALRDYHGINIDTWLDRYPEIVIANYNSPAQIVLSGKTDQINLLTEDFKNIGYEKFDRLKVSGAFHSPLMKPAQEKLRREIEQIKFKPPKFPIVQNVSARLETDPDIIKMNIIKQITSPVRWEESIKEIIRRGVEKIVEIGPGTILMGLVNSIDNKVIVENI